MRIVRIDDGPVVRLQLRGELDLATADQVEEQVNRALDDGARRLVLDVAGLTFCDSSGIDMFLNAHAGAAARGAELRVSRPRGIVRRSLDVTGVLPLLTRGQTVNRLAASRSRSASS
ncbi:STAS domain-containing protein [Actinoplanes sp. NPDC023714]|uniref:STAS domain-containing protein n=1 Tax=Actinoplanes sp. NPDC023714 TaxID=3154322 RepID=UPI0033C7917C